MPNRDKDQAPNKKQQQPFDLDALLSNVQKSIASDIIVASPEYAAYLKKKRAGWWINQMGQEDMIWKKKWLALHGTAIIYMHSKPDAATASTLRLKKQQLTEHSAVTTDDDEDPGAFSIKIDDNTTWYLRADDVDSKAIWIEKLSTTCGILGWLGEFDKLNVLGVGGQGTVYRLKHKRTGRVVALKEMLIQDEISMVAAVAEAHLLRTVAETVNHPNILITEKAFQVCGQLVCYGLNVPLLSITR